MIAAAADRLGEVHIVGRPVPAAVQEVGAAGGYSLVERISLVAMESQHESEHA